MIKINLLGDALAPAGAKKGGEKSSAEPVQVYTGEGGSRASLPIAGVVVGLVFAALGGVQIRAGGKVGHPQVVDEGRLEALGRPAQRLA